MQVKVRFLDNLRLEANFDDFSVIADQPIRYKGDGTAPGPFDYFMASSALCAAYFVKVYCRAREIPTEDISITQDNVVDPENRYKQTLRIRAEIPEGLSQRHRQGIIDSIERCSVKRVIQNAPKFEIDTVDVLGKASGLLFDLSETEGQKTQWPGKDSPLEETLECMSLLIKNLGITLEISSWRNIVPHVWSVHIRDAESPICYTNGKGASKEAALCSALGEYFERMSNNYFYNDYYLGKEMAASEFVHHPDEKWFQPDEEDALPEGLMDEVFLNIYDGGEEKLMASHLIDANSALVERGICALPFVRQSDSETVYVPVNLLGNLFVSNGMSAGNSLYEARVQSLAEIFERAIKNQIITEEMALPDIPQAVLRRHPTIVEGIKRLEDQGFPVLLKDASLGGRYPVLCMALMNPKTGGVFASFGCHPRFDVALERCLTELMQGRSFEGFNDVPLPTFNSLAVQEPNNIVEHFIDSTGVVSWRFFSQKSDYDFSDWNFNGSTKEEFNYFMDILRGLGKETYIADYEDLGVPACRILVPGFSEIYPIEDLIWENNNRGNVFREDILNIHSLPPPALESLVERLEDSDLDEFMPITDLIGIVFDDATPWGRCTVGEIKGLIYLALGNLHKAKEQVEAFLHYNDNTPERRKYYQLLDIVLSIQIDPELKLEDYQENLRRMYGNELLHGVVCSVDGSTKFYGLTPTDINFSGLDKHQRLIQSYRRLHRARGEFKRKTGE